MKIRKLRYAKHKDIPLGKNEPHSFSRKYALQHYSSGAIYTFIPKNACSTMRYSLSIANGFIDESTDPNWIHNNVHANSNPFRASDKDIATSEYTFVILRCPYKRLASAFLDKAVDLKVPFQLQCKSFNPAISSREEMIGFMRGITFSSFVKSLTSLPHESLDEHFRNQIDFLYYEDYDNWFNLEDFDAAKTALMNDLGLFIYDTRDKIGHHISGLSSVSGNYSDATINDLYNMKRSGRIPDAASLYNEESKQLIDTHFNEDLKLYRAKFGKEGLLF